MIRYYTGLDPDQLSNQEWATIIKQVEYARDQERKHSEREIGKLFGTSKR